MKVVDQKNGNHEKKTSGSGFAFWKVGLVGQVKTDDLSPDDIIIACVLPCSHYYLSLFNISI